MTYRRDFSGNSAQFQLNGKLTLEETAALRRDIWESLTRDGASEIVIDMQAVPTLDPSLISLFVSSKSLVAKYKATLSLIHMNDDCLSILQETSLLGYFGLSEA